MCRAPITIEQHGTTVAAHDRSTSYVNRSWFGVGSGIRISCEVCEEYVGFALCVGLYGGYRRCLATWFVVDVRSFLCTPDSPVGCTTLRACVWFFGLGTPKRRKLQGGGKPRLRGLSRPKRHSLNGEPRRPNKPSDPHRITHYKDVYGYTYIYVYIYIFIYMPPDSTRNGVVAKQTPPPDDLALGGVWQAGAPQNEAGGGSGRHQPPRGCPFAWVLGSAGLLYRSLTRLCLIGLRDRDRDRDRDSNTHKHLSRMRT